MAPIRIVERCDVVEAAIRERQGLEPEPCHVNLCFVHGAARVGVAAIGPAPGERECRDLPGHEAARAPSA
jgi:hypothetical protein